MTTSAIAFTQKIYTPFFEVKKILEAQTFLYFLISSILLTLAPGPDNLYLLTKSLSEGSKSGIILAAGLVSGIIFHTLLVMIGVAALIQSSPLALNLLKYFGAAYLLFLAFNAFRSSGEMKLSRADSKKSFIALYRRGVLMNVLNPKVLLFFLAFLPQFVNLSDTSASFQIAVLGLTFAIQGFIIFSLIAICAGRLRKFIIKNKNLGKIFGTIEGSVLTLIALALIFT